MASGALLPAMFGVLEDEDPHGILWSVFYIIEGLDDDVYLPALMSSLPGLWQRAPRWAETAVIRILNTRGEADDCVDTFIEVARAHPPDEQAVLIEILHSLTQDAEALAPAQSETIDHTLDALGESMAQAR
jgi:hypothetical protein